jgi:hypothetical protein
MADTATLAKVLIRVKPADWHTVGSETLWATPVGPSAYRLENSPFYAKGFSYLDVVLAEYDAGEGFPVAQRVLQCSGRSTYALWVIAGVESNGEFAKYWQPIEELGCTFEGARSKLLSVDVPASTDVAEAFRLMQLGEDAGVWYFQEQNYAHATAV